MKYKKLQNNSSGFVILFAVTISAILLAIALGVTNIALKEVKFGTSAKDTNDAFFAADTGTEYALFQDKNGTFTTNNFPLGGLGNTGQSCVIITVTKTGSPIATKIFSKGYNNGSGGSFPNWTCTTTANTVERELDTNY